ncbi:unnamed protein product [Prorocentrum cordatum]|uniref:Uncharacterized protein n=1 Tax=Prorocentrum cordatum TaxID=2364126 RepID=A0ABN9SW44_9DINO|nr:unnamed protein product [Polarella glacialis]
MRLPPPPPRAPPLSGRAPRAGGGVSDRGWVQRRSEKSARTLEALRVCCSFVLLAVVPDERKLAKFNKQLMLVLSSLMGVDRLLLRLRELQQQEVQRFCRAVSQLSDSGGGGTHREETSGTFKRSATQPTWSTTQSTEAPSQESQASRSPQRFLELAKLLPTEAPHKPPAKEEVLHIRQWLRCGAPLGADPHAFDRRDPSNFCLVSILTMLLFLILAPEGRGLPARQAAVPAAGPQIRVPEIVPPQARARPDEDDRAQAGRAEAGWQLHPGGHIGRAQPLPTTIRRSGIRRRGRQTH